MTDRERIVNGYRLAPGEHLCSRCKGDGIQGLTDYERSRGRSCRTCHGRGVTGLHRCPDHCFINAESIR